MRRDQAKRRYHRELLLGLLILFAVSWIEPPHPRYMVLQHVPSAILVAAVVWVDRYVLFSNRSMAMIVLFLALHVLGARYLYSFVPYDQWSTWLWGTSISDTFGLQRNHYDRLVHLGFGLLFVYPVHEMQVRLLKLPRWWSYVLAVQFVVATSAVYELAEWLAAVTLAPDWADRYIGQQGDIWDGQKDMTLAVTGAMVSSLLIACLESWKGAGPERLAEATQRKN